MATLKQSASSAEKRALWEVRQRYQIDQGRTIRAVPRAGSPHRPASPPPRLPPRPPRRQPAAAGSSHGSRRAWMFRIALGIVLVVVLSGGVFGYKILAASNKISSSERSILGQLKDLLFAQNKGLGGENDGRINLLMIAIGGQGHKGENLADSIMVISIHPTTHAVALLSIPRDLYVQVPGEEYYSKINAVHAYGESKKAGSGPAVIKEKVEEITGLPVHYYGRIDFIAFKEIVDAVGGIDITIENSFYDYWHKIAFSAGTEKMDGERALAYVRARYIEGPEGGDFKRAARQQQVLLALRDKIFSVNTAFDFSAVNSILNSLSDNIRTDMELWELKRFYELARQINHDQVQSVVLSTGPKGVLVGSTEVLGGVPASILKPRTGDYSEIHALAQNIFASPDPSHVSTPVPETTPSPSPSPSAEASKPTVEVRNGTTITGLAAETATKLEAEGYTVTSIGNAATRSQAKTTVYALADDATSGAQAVAELLEAQADSGLPEGEAESSAQIVVILGADTDD